MFIVAYKSWRILFLSFKNYCEPGRLGKREFVVVESCYCTTNIDVYISAVF